MSVFRRAIRRLGRLATRDLERKIDGLARDFGGAVDRELVLLGHIASQLQTLSPPPQRLEQAEFRVYSQWGEDGILQYLLRRVPIERRIFVEFGVESYAEANTRFLLASGGWSGLVMEADASCVRAIRESDLCWRYHLTAKHARVTRENVDALIAEAGIAGDIGVLSIDVDGNDYWIWDAIRGIQPRIVVCEYNSLFGSERPVTVPYDPGFERRQAHPSQLYFGASLPALCRLAEQKGYRFVGCNGAGVNAFFVRELLAEGLPSPSWSEGFVATSVRQALDAEGRLTGEDALASRARLDDLPVWDCELGREVPLREVPTGGGGPAT